MTRTIKMLAIAAASAGYLLQAGCNFANVYTPPSLTNLITGDGINLLGTFNLTGFLAGFGINI